MTKQAVLLIFLLSIFCAYNPLKSQKKIDFSPQEVQWMADNPDVRLGYDPQWPPFEWHDEAQGFVGLSSEYVNFIEQSTGLNIVPVKYSNWISIIEALKKGDLDLVSAMNPCGGRRQFFDFSPSYFTTPNVYVTRKGKDLEGGLPAYSGLKVGVVQGYNIESFLHDKYPEIEFVAFEDVEQGLVALAIGEVSAFAGSLAVINYLIENKGILGLEVGGQIDGLEQFSICMAGRKDRVLLNAIVAKVLASMSEVQCNEFNKKWVSLEAWKSTVLTQAEKQWVAEHPVITSHIQSSPPYHYWENGPAGVSIDILEMISTKFGFQIEYNQQKTFSESLQSMKDRALIDLLPLAENTSDRREFIAFTEDFAIDAIVIYMPVASEEIFGLYDLKGKTIAMPKGFALIERLKDNSYDIKVEEFSSRLECLQAVNDEEVDAYVGNLMVGRYLMLHHDLKNVKVAAPSLWAAQKFAFGVRKDQAILASILDKGLASISQEERAALYLKHYTYIPNKINYKPFLGALIVAVLIIGLILLLNWQLHKRVNNRTRALNNALSLRKKAEQKLKEHNENLEEEVEQQVSEIKKANRVTNRALQIAHAGTWFYDAEIAKDAYFFSIELFDILGESSFDADGPIPMAYWDDNLLKTNIETGSKALAYIKDLMTNPNLDPHLIFQYTRPVDGRIIWLEATAEAEFDSEGHLVKMKGLSRDITSEKLVEEKLMRAHALSQNALSLSNSATWHIDYRSPECYHASDEDVKMKGLLPKKNNEYHIVNDWYKNLCAADQELAEKTRANYQKAMDGSSEFDATYRFRRPIDGEIIWLREKAQLVKDENGNELFMYGVTQDVTLQKEQEAKKERELQRIISMQEVAKVGSWYIDFSKDPDKIFSDDNQMKVQGEIPGDPIGFTAWGKNLLALEGDGGASVFNMVKESMADPNCFEWSGEYEYTRPIDKKKIWVRTMAFTTRDDHGTPVYIHGISQDITEQKQQVLEINKSQKRLQALFDNMPNGFAEHEIILDKDGRPVDYRFLHINSAFTDQTGLQSSVIGKTVKEVDSNISNVWIQRYGKVAMTGESISFEEYSSSLKRHYRVYAFSTQKGHFAVLFDDVTVQREQREQLKLVNNVLAFAQTVAGVGHFEYYPMEDRVSSSNEYLKIFEVGPDTIVSLESFLSFIYEDDVALVLDAMDKAIKNQEPLDMVFRIKTDNGLRFIHEQGKYEFDIDDNAIYLLGTAQDITELKKSENLIQEQHHFLQALLNSMPDFVFAKDLDGTFSLANYQFEQYLGKTADKIIGKMDEDLFEKGQADINLQMDAIVYKEGRNIAYEELLLHSNGSEVLYEKTKTPIVDSQGDIIGMIGMGKDITEKRKTEVEILNKEKSFRNLFEQSNDAILIIDIAQNSFLDCNNALVNLVGLSSKEDLYTMAIGQFSPEFQTNGEESSNVIREVMLLAVTTGYAKRQYELLNQRTGARVFCNISFNKTEFKNKEVIQVIARDITDIKEAENVLVNSKKHIEEILNTIPIGISVIDRNTGKSILMNNTIKEMLEIDDFEVFDFDDPLISDNENSLRDIKGDLFNDKMLQSKELELIKAKSGQHFWAQATSSRREYFDTDATLVCLYDTTLLKETEIALDTAKQAAEAANIAKSAFLANMSHEIRTPMNAIIGFSEILNRKIIDDEQRRHLSSIQSSGKTLLKLINNILDLSKIEAGKMDLLYDFVSVNQLISELNLLFEAKANEKGLEFEAIVSKNFPRSIEVDELRLRQVAINLLGNAIKFTQSGFVNIVFSAENQTPDSITLVIKVSDSGIGIAKSKVNEVFNDFTQEDGSTTRNFGGTGLGLSISKNIVKLFGGTIIADSEVGNGTSFIVEIPKVKYTDEQFTLAEIEGVNPMAVEFEPAKLLIVDDVSSNRDVLQSHLEMYSFELFFASNGQEAVDVAIELQPDLILMDMRMPVMDGYAATKILVEDDRTQKIPIVACTASAFKTTEEEILKLGFSGYLRKPILVKSLISELTRHLKYREIEIIAKDHENYTVVLTEDQRLEMPDVVKALERVREIYWLPIKKSQNMRKVRKFAEALELFNETYHFEHIEQYVIALLKAVDNFDVENIKMLVQKFSKMFDEMSASYEEC